MTDSDELERALAFPWDRWTTFLHPAQRELVERDYRGPARVSGSAGTGKTIVALHRAVLLTRNNPESRVLLTTFSEPLANALRARVRRLISNEPRLAERLEVHSMDAIAIRLYEVQFGPSALAPKQKIQEWLSDAAGELKFSPRFLLDEWTELVDAWQLTNWEDYRDVKRLGRKTRLPESQREALWKIFEAVRSRLHEDGLITMAELFTKLAAKLPTLRRRPFDFVVVDESQDVSVPQLRLLAALGGTEPNGLFFAGDLGQRIFQRAFSWKSLGVDVRGRARTLNINYRTSHQIRGQADRLLGPSVADVDGNTEERRGTVSVFNGPLPIVRSFATEAEEGAAVARWLIERIGEDGVSAHEIGVFVRSDAQLDRARAALEKAGQPFKVLDGNLEPGAGSVSICTMHLAKGLEFRAVAVMACDDEIIPLQERIESVGDEADLQEIYDTERQLLYVACTRARDQLMVTSADPASEFLDDIGKE